MRADENSRAAEEHPPLVLGNKGCADFVNMNFKVMM